MGRGNQAKALLNDASLARRGARSNNIQKFFSSPSLPALNNLLKVITNEELNRNKERIIKTYIKQKYKSLPEVKKINVSDEQKAFSEWLEKNLKPRRNLVLLEEEFLNQITPIGPLAMQDKAFPAIDAICRGEIIDKTSREIIRKILVGTNMNPYMKAFKKRFKKQLKPHGLEEMDNILLDKGDFLNKHMFDRRSYFGTNNSTLSFVTWDLLSKASDEGIAFSKDDLQYMMKKSIGGALYSDWFHMKNEDKKQAYSRCKQFLVNSPGNKAINDFFIPKSYFEEIGSDDFQDLDFYDIAIFFTDTIEKRHKDKLWAEANSQ